MAKEKEQQVKAQPIETKDMIDQMVAKANVALHKFMALNQDWPRYL